MIPLLPAITPGKLRHLRFKLCCRHLSPNLQNQLGGLLATLKGGPQGQKCISESGLYKLVMRSDKPEARPFQDWVTRDVLPNIRKHGGYISGMEELNDPSAAEARIAAEAARVRQEAQAEHLEARYSALKIIGRSRSGSRRR